MDAFEYFAYVSFMISIFFVPALILDWILGVVYRHCRWFRRRINRFFRSLPGWR